ncbi:MAG: hypothetical protein ACRDH9_11875 [Actinomycetota bacterium]
MFEISESAESALRKIRADSELADSIWLRIAPVSTTEGEITIGIAFTDGPEEGDLAVSSKADFGVYMAAELAGSFGKACLQTTSDAEGIELQVRTQADLHDHGGNGDATLPKMLLARRAL